MHIFRANQYLYTAWLCSITFEPGSCKKTQLSSLSDVLEELSSTISNDQKTNHGRLSDERNNLYSLFVHIFHTL